MEPLSDTERELALHYAPREMRVALRCLWALDERMGAIVASTSEAALGEMRLLWWRESLEGLDGKVPAEPLLEQAARILADDSASAADWGAIAEGWHALLQAPIDRGELDRFARERGGGLFVQSARILGAQIDSLEAAGAAWALTDLAANSASAELTQAATKMARDRLSEIEKSRWPARLRPLGALVALARRDAVGDPRSRRQGSPGRVARMAWHRLTGR